MNYYSWALSYIQKLVQGNEHMVGMVGKAFDEDTQMIEDMRDILGAQLVISKYTYLLDLLGFDFYALPYHHWDQYTQLLGFHQHHYTLFTC